MKTISSWTVSVFGKKVKGKVFIDEKWFLFHLKSSFCSQDIYIFVLTFCSCRENGLIRNIDNQTMKVGQLIEYNKNIIFL